MASHNIPMMTICENMWKDDVSWPLIKEFIDEFGVHNPKNKWIYYSPTLQSRYSDDVPENRRTDLFIFDRLQRCMPKSVELLQHYCDDKYHIGANIAKTQPLPHVYISVEYLLDTKVGVLAGGCTDIPNGEGLDSPIYLYEIVRRAWQDTHSFMGRWGPSGNEDAMEREHFRAWVASLEKGDIDG